MTYRAPITDIRFTLDLIGFDRLGEVDRYRDLDADVVAGILDEAGRFTSDVVAPLARVGDTVGSKLEDGEVATPPGYLDAYRQLAAAGWTGVPFPEEFGGGGMPWTVGLAIQELVTTADVAFSLCPMLTAGGTELLISHGSDEQRATYLENLVSGEWTGTMVLTEPQAGSDLGAMTARAEPADDGTYRIKGTKIFITWGDHDMTENIIHFVLARVPDAPAGSRGISCFIVPKYLVEPDGSLGARNDVKTVSIEHKLGIHASPTCVLAFGDESDGAVGYLIGEEHQGLRYMFTMMNNARLSIGLQGLAVAERAYQQASLHARERIQGAVTTAEGHEPAPIIKHPDVRRMLMMMRARIEAMRAVMYRNALAIDLGDHHPNDEVRAREADLAALLTPVSKAWGTDLGVEMASLGIQVHGGMGFVEETGAAQWWRDARIAPIYEGTNGIQAIDLVARKLPLSDGNAIAGLLAEVAETASSAPDELGDIAAALNDAHKAVESATGALMGAENDAALAGATVYLNMLGDLLGGWMLLRGAINASGGNGYADEFLEGRVATARFYASQVLTTVPGRLGAVQGAAAGLFDIPEEAFPQA